MASSLDFRNVNSLWCSVLAETLYRCGVRHAVTAPGSRSTPLTMAFARHAGIEAIPVLDERSAAFFALGLARQHHRPVVLVCTSGTAAANFFPAVIEARESGVPLLVITADRPPELRECCSGQTIDQQKLYGSYPRWQHEFAVPEASLPMLAYLRQTAAHAFNVALSPQPGPIHLNAPFRDPLPPISDVQRGKIEWRLRLGAVFRPSLPTTGSGIGCPLAAVFDGRARCDRGRPSPACRGRWLCATGRSDRAETWLAGPRRRPFPTAHPRRSERQSDHHLRHDPPQSGGRRTT